MGILELMNRLERMNRPPHTREYRYYDFVMAAYVCILLCSNLIGPAKDRSQAISLIAEWNLVPGTLEDHVGSGGSTSPLAIPERSPPPIGAVVLGNQLLARLRSDQHGNESCGRDSEQNQYGQPRPDTAKVGRLERLSTVPVPVAQAVSSLFALLRDVFHHGGLPANALRTMSKHTA